MTDDKPALHLSLADLAFDVDTAVAFLTALTGRAPMTQEVAELRALFEQQLPRH